MFGASWICQCCCSLSFPSPCVHEHCRAGCAPFLPCLVQTRWPYSRQRPAIRTTSLWKPCASGVPNTCVALYIHAIGFFCRQQDNPSIVRVMHYSNGTAPTHTTTHHIYIYRHGLIARRKNKSVNPSTECDRNRRCCLFVCDASVAQVPHTRRSRVVSGCTSHVQAHTRVAEGYVLFNVLYVI